MYLTVRLDTTDTFHILQILYLIELFLVNCLPSLLTNCHSVTQDHLQRRLYVLLIANSVITRKCNGISGVLVRYCNSPGSVGKAPS